MINLKFIRYILGGRVGASARYSIGPSCYLFVATVLGRTWRFIIDCGVEPSPYGAGRGIDLKNLEAILGGEKIDAVFVTHAHLDHCGFLPALIPYLASNAKIYATSTTAALLTNVFTDTLAQGVRTVGVLGNLPYTFWPLLKARSKERIVVVKSPGAIKIGPGIEVLVWPAGHINGACSFIFKVSEHNVTRKFAFLGDYSVHHQILVAGAPLPPPEWLLDGEDDAILSIDCTNGEVDLPPWQQALDAMADESDRVVEQGGKWVAVTFSLVRWQLIIGEMLKRVERQGRKSLIYGDGPSAQYIARVLKENPWYGDEAFDLSGAAMVGKDISRGDLIGLRGGARIVTPSGMGSGPATDYLVAGLDDPSWHIAFTGYAAHGTNARMILDAKDEQEIALNGAGFDEEGEPIKIRVKAGRSQYRITGHQLRLDGMMRALELFGCKFDNLVWRRGERQGNLKEWLSDGDLKRLSRKHLGLTHANTKAFDWFEDYCAGWIPTSRADRKKDRCLEF